MTEKNWNPKIVAFVCNWCTYAGADLAGTSRLKYDASVRVMRVPCTGRIDTLFIVKAFEQGDYCVLVSGCQPGDCHYNAGNYQKNNLEEKFKNFYERLASDDLEHIHIDIKTILDEIGDSNLRKVLKMEYRKLRQGYGDSMLIEYEKWNLQLNHAYRKSLYISKHNDRTYHYSEPDKNLNILQEFLEMIKERCKDAGLNIT